MDFRVSLLHKVSTACASCCVSAYFRAEKHQSQRTCTLLAPFFETPLVVRFSFFLFTPKRSKADVLLHHDRDGFVDNRAHLPRARADARGRRATRLSVDGRPPVHDKRTETTQALAPIKRTTQTGTPPPLRTHSGTLRGVARRGHQGPSRDSTQNNRPQSPE